MPETVYLSFDIEEFDMPLEYGQVISLEEQISISTEGCTIILDVLKKHNVPATFFSTVVFASHASNIIRRIGTEGHELASHGYYHSRFEDGHYRESKVRLEELSGMKVNGFRMARMQPVNNAALQEAGYTYNSSLNPVYLPGRYNHFFAPRTFHQNGNLLEIPASATPVLRIPLFWLSFHNFPPFLYRTFSRVTMARDKYLNLYFHPWEFTNLKQQRFGLPWYVTKRTGNEMIDTFEAFIVWAKKKKFRFGCLQDLVNKGHPVKARVQ